MNQYLRPDMKPLVQRVEGAEAEKCSRNWTGNDQTKRERHDVVRLDESPLRLCLSWKTGTKETAKPIGVFVLDLRKLLEEEYVRDEPGKEEEGGIRLRFYHALDNVIYIQVNGKVPALPVGIGP